MAEGLNEIKQRIIEEIRTNVPVFYKVSPIQYRIRCPICGDSKSNPRDAHCYIKCSYDPDEPLLYNCFKCSSGGRITPWFLKQLHLNKSVISLIEDQKYNRITSVKNATVDVMTGDPIVPSTQTKYIEDRLGKGFTIDDYDRFKIVWDMDIVKEYVTSERMRHSLPSNNNSISFISDDKSLIMNRTFLGDDAECRWRKIKIIQSDQRSFYTIKSTLDLFTFDTIVVNIAEGIFDILSVYKNFNDGNNSVFIATLGSDYISAVEYSIAKGFIGRNVIIKIYIDDGIDEKLLQTELKEYKWMFDAVYVYKNILYKDVGVTLDRIKLIERRM